MILLFSLFIFLIIVFFGIIPQKMALKYKIAAGILSAVISFKFYIFSFASGKLFAAPQWPAWLLLLSTWLYAMLLFSALFLLIFQLAALIIKKIAEFRKRKVPSFFTDPAWKALTLIPAALIVSYGIYCGLKLPEVVKHEITHPALPAEADGFTIALLSDIHADPFTRQEKISRIVDLTNSCKADLIVITGDFVDGKINMRGNDLQVLQNLSAPHGVFGVPGNHEYYSGYSGWMAFLRRCSIKMLTNSHSLVADGKITLAGVTDPAAYRMKKEKPDIEKALAGSPENNFRILLAHQPKLAYHAADAGIHLQLSGHTHGGMIYGLDRIVALFNKNFVSGAYHIGNMVLFISNGTGIWNGFPLRLGHSSEIVIITLRKTPADH